MMTSSQPAPPLLRGYQFSSVLFWIHLSLTLFITYLQPVSEIYSRRNAENYKYLFKLLFLQLSVFYLFLLTFLFNDEFL